MTTISPDNPNADLQALGGPATKGRSLWGDAWLRLRRDKAAMICLGVIALYVLIAISGAVYGWVAAADPDDDIVPYERSGNYDTRDQAPQIKGWNPFVEENWRYLLGTDWQGKSVLYKTLLGAKIALAVGFVANIIAVPLGMLLGALAGYYGGKIDTVIVWLFTTLASIPGIILLVALKYAFKDVTVLGVDLSGIVGLYVALSIVSWIGICRLVRAETLKLRELDYVVAARAIGTPGPVILLRHILPNVVHLGIIRFSLGFIGAIKAEVTLSFLNLGVEGGTPSWGIMINQARTNFFAGRYWELVSAVVAMFFLVLALNIFGDRLRDALDPRLKNVT